MTSWRDRDGDGFSQERDNAGWTGHERAELTKHTARKDGAKEEIHKLEMNR